MAYQPTVFLGTGLLAEGTIQGAYAYAAKIQTSCFINVDIKNMERVHFHFPNED